MNSFRFVSVTLVVASLLAIVQEGSARVDTSFAKKMKITFAAYTKSAL